MFHLSGSDRRVISYFSISLGMLLILLSLSYTYKNLGHLSSQNLLVTNSIYVVSQTSKYKQAAKDVQSNVRGYLIAEDNTSLADIDKARFQLAVIGDTLSGLLQDDEIQQMRVGEMKAAEAQLVDFFLTVLNYYRAVGPEAAFELIKSGQGRILSDRLSRKVEEIEAQAGIELTLRRNQFDRNRQRATMYIIITGIAGFGITLLSLYFLFIDRKKQIALKREIFQKERLLNQYLTAIPDGIVVVNPLKEVTFINQAGRTMLGLHKDREIRSLDELIAETKLADPKVRGRAFTTDTLPICGGLLGKRSIGNRIDIRQGDELVKVATNVEPIYELNGQIVGSISTFRDVTEQEAYATNLNAARNLAEQSVKTRDVFLSNVSHEIRTPLNAILGFTNCLMQEGKYGGTGEYIGYIQVASRNLLELIDDLLDISKIEADQIVLDLRPVSVREIVESVGIIVKQKATEKHITYRQHLDEDLPEAIVTDQLRLTQILLNLCGNAVKFTEEGSVHFEAKAMGQARNGSQRIQFAVTDTGIGIPADRQKEIFDRFVQASESTSGKYGGTGLGLSISKALVKLLSGDLKLESTVGVGTRFVLEFDFAVLHESIGSDFSDLTTQVSGQLAALNILAAEDNPLNQKLLQAIFDRTEANVTVVSNGLEVLEKLKSEPYDLVIMDVQMPVMDGYTAIREIRSTLGMDIPIITLTAHAMVGEKEEGARIGANSYLSKPFKEADLFREVLRLTRKIGPPLATETRDLAIAPAQQSLVDEKYLREITADDQVLREELIALFATSRVPQYEKILGALEKQDYEMLAKAIHALRSSLISVALLATATKFREIERALASGVVPDHLAETLSALDQELTDGLRELQATVCA